MRGAVAACVLAAACASPSTSLPDEPVIDAVRPDSAPSPAPWGIVRFRSCGWRWDGEVVVSGDEVVGCGGAVFARADGRFIEQRPPIDPEPPSPSAIPGCSEAWAVGRLGDRDACLADELLVVEGGEARRLPRHHRDARFSDGYLLVADDDGLSVFVDLGDVRRLDMPEPSVLDVRDGVALLSSNDRVVLLTLSSLEIERVFDRHAPTGALHDEGILIESGRDLLWLARGTHFERSARAVATPAGLIAMTAGADEGEPVWIGAGGMMNRGRDEVAAFVRPVPPPRFDLGHGWASHHLELASPGTLQLTVSVTDLEELAALDDDAWGRALCARALPHGCLSDAGYVGRGPDGRVFRGHVYVGGCARVHVDVMVREIDGVLERWTIESGDRPSLRRHVDAILGPMPRDARAVRVAGPSGLDPSIERVGP